MSTYIKINNEWTVISKIFKKENNSWVEQNNLITALGNLVYLYGGHTAMTVIIGESQYIGKSFLLTARKGGEVVYPTWSIISGNDYATINSNGKVTINAGALNNSITVQASYDRDIVNKIITVSYDNQLTIEGSDLMTGTSGNVIARYNSNIVSPSWSITTGSEYATIDSSGNITILSDGNIVVSAAYSSYSATKNITLVYDAGTTSQTEVDPDTGSITTTTTTTTTDPETGATTETSSSTVTNEDGSTSNTSSETITNTDGSSSTTSTTTNSDGSSSETTSTTSAPDESGSTTTESNTTTTNADGTSSETNSTIVENEDGSSSSQSETVHYDENGDTTGSTTNDTEVNADGSSTSSTTNFNADGDPTDQQNIATDTTGNVDTQDVEFDENGDSTVVGYEIDTTASDGSGKDLTGNGVNTEFVPFAFEEGFTMHMRFRTVASEQPVPPVVEDTEDTGTNYLYNIMSAKSTTKINNVWPGFDIRWAIAKTGSASTFQFRRTLVGESSSTSTDIKSRHLNDVFDFIVTYNPAESSRKFSLHDNLANDYALSVNKQLQNDLNLELTIGYALNMQGNPYRYSNVTIYDFIVARLDSTVSITAPTISCDGTRVNITCSTPGALIYYRTATENLYDLYTSEFLINFDTTVQAYAVLQHKISSVTTQVCEYDDGRPSAPVITCTDNYVTITCATAGAQIYYRTGGGGDYALYTSPFEISVDTFVEAYSSYDGLTSDVVSETCDYDSGAPDEPVITCDGEHVTISCSTPEAVIYYSTDGENYDIYHSAFPIYNDVTVYAYSELDNLTSNIVSEECEYTGTEPATDYDEEYLTFNVLTSGTISWKALGSGAAKTIEYSKNNGSWTSLAATSAGATISVEQGDKVRFRGSNTTYCASNKNNYSGFEGGTATYNIEGNIMSLVYGDNFAEQTTLPSNWIFCSIFKKSNVISAENLILPADTLTYACYRAMFSNATSLEVPPALPATVLADYCYWYMFENCAITTAPELLAETLTAYSYGYMFTGCSNLNYIRCLAKTKSATSCLQNWVNNVAATGTFIKDSNTSWSTGISAIPVGWVVYNDEILQSPVISCDGEHITITCETPDASIYYKLNDAANYSEYTSIITITEDTTVYAYSSKSDNQSPVIEQECIYVEHIYKFTGLEIASGPLYYDSSDGYVIKDSWIYNSYDSSYGKVAGSTYFNFIEMGKLFEDANFDVSSGNIENRLDPLDSWRLPTKAEWDTIIGTTRPGSTVNGDTGKHYAFVRITDSSYAGSSSFKGLLLFPDSETITGETLTADSLISIKQLTTAQLTVFLEQGCVFLPHCGCYDSQWKGGATGYGIYASSTEQSNSTAYHMSEFDAESLSTLYASKSNYYMPILVREASYGAETPFEASNKILLTWER